jgi:hypothetical protein
MNDKFSNKNNPIFNLIIQTNPPDSKTQKQYPTETPSHIGQNLHCQTDTAPGVTQQSNITNLTNDIIAIIIALFV